MKKKAQISQSHKSLIRRYLLWAYKTTKEEFERIERKTTQLIVDEYILGHFTKNKCEIPEEFKAYISGKRNDEIKLKFADAKKKEMHPNYIYLKNRLTAIEAAIEYFLGSKELKIMSQGFEEEFTRRIWEAREH